MTQFADSLALWLADYYLLSTVLLALALVGIAVLKQPAQRLAIAKAALVALTLLAALCALPRWSAVHLLSAAPQQQAQANASPTLLLDSNQPAHVVPAASSESPIPESVASAEPAPADSAPARDWPSISWPAAIAIVHLCGSLGVMAWLSVGSLAARGLRLSATPAPAELAALLTEVAAARRPVSPKLAIPSFGETRLRAIPSFGETRLRRVELLLSDRIAVPVALGIRRPAILLPASWLSALPLPPGEGRGEGGSPTTKAPSPCPLPKGEGLPPDQLRSVLAHELAHIRNHDLSWLAASRMLMILLWAQPLYWFLRRRMRLDQEALADAAAAELTSRQHYAEQLVAWARNIKSGHAVRLSTAVGLWESPSQLRSRIGFLLDEHFSLIRKCSHKWRMASLAVCALLATGLSLVTLSPAALEITQQSTSSPVQQMSQSNSEGRHVDFPIVVAKHVLIHDGKVIHWLEVKELIAALPNPALARLRLFFTSGVPDWGQAAMMEKAKELEKQYQCKLYSFGGLDARAEIRYDAIKSRFDLVPNEAWRVSGVVQNADAVPVANAEIVLCLPPDKSLSRKTLNIYLRNGRLREPLEEIVTASDEKGGFAVYPTPDAPYYLVALHRDGFGLVRSDEFAKSGRIMIKPWGKIAGRVKTDARIKQSVLVIATIPAKEGWPETSFWEFADDLTPKQPSSDGQFQFDSVPSDVGGTLYRLIGSGKLPYKEFRLGPGAMETIEMQPPTDNEIKEFKKLPSDDPFGSETSEKAQVSLSSDKSRAGKFRLVQNTSRASSRTTDAKSPPTLLSYGDGKPDGKKSYGGSGHMIRFELPEGVTKVKGIRIHGSRYGLPQAPDEDFEITFLSEKRDEVLHTESAPYKLFKRGKENWVRVLFKEEVELPRTFWIALDFNAEQTKGVYLSYDTSTKGQHSRVGKAGDEEEPKETDFAGDWMVQLMLSVPKPE